MPLIRSATSLRLRGIRRSDPERNTAHRPSRHGAAEHQLVERVGQPEHAGADRVALLLVGVQQPRRRRPATGGGELPAQVHRITEAGVHALATERGMHVRGVTGQKRPAGPVVPCLPSLAEKP